jgi:hypothetical protein
MDTQGITRHITRMDMVGFTGISQEHTQVHRHITGTHTVSQTCHKNGYTTGSYRDLSLSTFRIEDP